MYSYYTFIALDIAAQRTSEAARERLAATGREDRDRSTRRAAAVALAAVGRLVAGTVRRLDACVADDLAKSLASTH
jgi:hypothetical protein